MIRCRRGNCGCLTCVFSWCLCRLWFPPSVQRQARDRSVVCPEVPLTLWHLGWDPATNWFRLFTITTMVVEENDIKDLPKFDNLLPWRCCQFKNVASVKVGLKEMENAARLDSILSLSRVRNRCYLHWRNFNQSMSYFQSSAKMRYTLSPFTCVCMFRTLCLWGFILIEGSSGAAAWNGFTLTAFSFRSLHSKKGRHCCVCVGTTCSLSFHSGKLSGVHPAEIDAATHRHMYYVDSHYTWKLSWLTCSLVA